MIDLVAFFNNQLEQWPEAAARYEALCSVEQRQIAIGPYQFTLQHNPARIQSTAAKTDAASIAHRPCFLCQAHRPAEQIFIAHGGYQLLVNPFPIFNPHFVIASEHHEPQQIAGHAAHMIEWTRLMPGYTIFFNGAKCGASAPDHLHFQAVESKHLPIWQHFAPLVAYGPIGAIGITSTTANEIERALTTLGENINILMRAEGNQIHTIIIPRPKHRPDEYFCADNPILISPASIDLAGCIITPRSEDFTTLTPTQLQSILSQVAYPPTQLPTTQI